MVIVSISRLIGFFLYLFFLLLAFSFGLIVWCILLNVNRSRFSIIFALSPMWELKWPWIGIAVCLMSLISCITY